MESLIENCLALKNLIEMSGNPVSIKYCQDIPENRFNINEQVICQSLQDARYGGEIAICKENSKCSGGSYFLGLLEFDAKILDFWINIEKTHINRCVGVGYMRKIPAPPVSVAKYVTLASIEKATEIPDLIAFFCNPAKAARLMGLHIFQKGCPSQIYSYAAACAAAVGIPMVTGDLHVSFIDNSARLIAGFKEDELIVTIPAVQIESMASNIKKCIWGTAEAPYLSIEKRLKGTWELKQK